eukprot:CAMPEP_0114513746 /NCGR_PEP_ID=MMETSP0109-20121206/15759_1 /TAXON_ID=29199 /ORGANISM="Chlorarachnion reptans, Strain CCCM449" /LENGTH=150 /DNA_ID=CAMNT_0001693689 /DNA_START=104 /DNA_END=556 /DNA_ORIENTATION=+
MLPFRLRFAVRSVAAIAPRRLLPFLSRSSFARGIATDSKEYDQFVINAFQIFDLNGDNKIEPYEVAEAYKYNSAGAELNRLIEKNDLGGKGVTWRSLDILDLVKASKEGNVELDSSGNIQYDSFKSWLSTALEEFKKLDNSLEGSQVEHE